MKDLRLYYYESGTLRRVGNSKSDKSLRNRHYFTSLEEVENHIEKLTERWLKGKQFVIVEYFELYKSKIIKIIDNGHRE
jgi:hypothetical protein